MNQLDFDFRDQREETTARLHRIGQCGLFLAALPNAEAVSISAALVRGLYRQHRLSGGIRPEKLWHVTLHGIDIFPAVPEEIVFAISAAVCGVAMAPFEIAFDRVMSFNTKPPHPLVLCCRQPDGPVMELISRLAEAMDAAGLRVKPWKTANPHMTLAYHPRLLPPAALETPVRLRVREFVLVKSLVGRSLHERLNRWPLLA